MQSSQHLVLGVDGGGTKTVAWLASHDDASDNGILGRGTAGPGNPRAVGFSAAQANIAAAIEAAFANAGRPQQQVASVCLSLAGAGRAEEQAQIRAWARRAKVAGQVSVTGDAEPVLAAATADNVGIALISGTGSLAWGRDASGRTARSGGWGYLLGDEGSGYWIALAGLQAAVRAADGRGPATLLLDQLQQAIGAASPPNLVEKVYQPEMGRPRIAELSDVVLRTAEEGDGPAARIMCQAGRELADMVRATAQALGFRAGRFTLALTGGVLVAHDLLRRELLQALEQSASQPANIAVVSEPVRGALVLARQAPA